MPTPENDLKALLNASNEQRLAYCIKTCATEQKIWILTDEHGCMMLNTEDEDCVAIWPSAEAATQWAADDWEACTATSIPLQDWLNRWTDGLAEDEVAVVVFPNTQEEGIILSSGELAVELNKKK